MQFNGLCVCVRERERGGGEREREREIEGGVIVVQHCYYFNRKY